jgi:transposase, IS5 family
MRTRHTTQPSIFLFRPEHEMSRVFEGVSHWLDEHPEVLGWIEQDIGADRERGRTGMTCEQVLRIGLVKQYRQCSYRALCVSLADSLSIQYFTRVDPLLLPARSTLQANVSAIKAETWEQLNRILVSSVLGTKFEPGKRIRIDSTVSATHILSPTDSKLLYDSLRVMVRFLKEVKPWSGIKYVNHCRRAKRRMFGAHSAKGATAREAMYRALMKDVDQTRVWVLTALEVLKKKHFDDVIIERMEAFLPLVAQVMDQTQRRVFEGESVPADGKLVSVFEHHTDIIKKGGRDVHYGHKVNLTTGKSGLVLDAVIEHGNPADETRFVPMLERYQECYGQVPSQVAVDGGYSSEANLKAAKALGVESVGFHKRRNLTIEEMTGGDRWLYRQLRNFRAGIEAGISYLKRCFGLGRVYWKGWEHFCASVWSSIFAHNLVRLSRSS